MALSREYFENQTTAELKEALAADLDGIRELETDDILTILEILVKREPLDVDPEAAFQEFLTYYLPEGCLEEEP